MPDVTFDETVVGGTDQSVPSAAQNEKGATSSSTSPSASPSGVVLEEEPGKDVATASNATHYGPSASPSGVVLEEEPGNDVATAINATHYGDVPAYVVCQECGSTVTTKVRFQIGVHTVLVCLILIFIGLLAGCCFIPFLLNCCKDAVHSCPQCRKDLGRYFRTTGNPPLKAKGRKNQH